MCFRGLRGTKFEGGAEVPLLIEVRELEAHPVDFDEELEPGAIDFGPDVRQIADLKSAGRAQLVREHHGKHDQPPSPASSSEPAKGASSSILSR